MYISEWDLPGAALFWEKYWDMAFLHVYIRMGSTVLRLPAAIGFCDMALIYIWPVTTDVLDADELGVLGVAFFLFTHSESDLGPIQPLHVLKFGSELAPPASWDDDTLRC
jgi:hypothetical protein